MSKKLVLLSGKGGSGKTSLALAMASMLANCRIKVLLVDCDLSTNGATYFYEEQLGNYDESLNTFYQLVMGPVTRKVSVVKINSNMNFLPSLRKVTKNIAKTYSYKNGDENEFADNFEDLYGNDYDVIIFDCQAGYADVLRLILPLSDVNLVVLEPDAINGSAIRSLHLKIGEQLHEKTYQVFNMLSQEDFETYSKTNGGTLFLTLECIRYDSTVKKAFALAKIPDMANTSAMFGEHIYNICSQIFNNAEIQRKLKFYKNRIEKNLCAEKEKTIQAEIDKLKKKQIESGGKFNRLLAMTISSGFLAVLLMFYFMLADQPFFSDRIQEIFTVVLITFFGLSVALFCSYMVLDVTKEKKMIDYEIGIQTRLLEEQKKIRSGLDDKALS